MWADGIQFAARDSTVQLDNFVRKMNLVNKNRSAVFKAVNRLLNFYIHIKDIKKPLTFSFFHYSPKSKFCLYLYRKYFYYSPLNIKIIWQVERTQKNVNYIWENYSPECLINSMFIPGTNKAKADELMAEVLKNGIILLLVSIHTEPGNGEGL